MTLLVLYSRVSPRGELWIFLSVRLTLNAVHFWVYVYCSANNEYPLNVSLLLCHGERRILYNTKLVLYNYRSSLEISTFIQIKLKENE